jgi:hypothetical protein
LWFSIVSTNVKEFLQKKNVLLIGGLNHRNLGKTKKQAKPPYAGVNLIDDKKKSV